MNTDDYDVIDKFREFALDQGIVLPENIIADGKLHRFRIEGEGKDKQSGAYGLHLDGRPAGFVQNFKTDEKATKWKYTDPNYKKEPITPEKIKDDAERKVNAERKAEAERKADIENKAQAAIQVRKEWNNTKASDHNPYAERKGIQLHNARISEYKGEQQLIIPLQDKAGKLVSLQRIKEKVQEDGAMDSVKMLFKEAQKQGAFSVLNKQPDPQIIAIAEGFATTASVIEDRYSVKNNIMGVMAVDAGNLKAVAEAMRELHPNAEILIFGDKGDLNDKGEKAAIEAARVVNGYSVMPPITKGDFNDYLTGKAGNITISLENLINQSMGKVMAEADKNVVISIIGHDVAYENDVVQNYENVSSQHGLSESIGLAFASFEEVSIRINGKEFEYSPTATAAMIATNIFNSPEMSAIKAENDLKTDNILLSGIEERIADIQGMKAEMGDSIGLDKELLEKILNSDVQDLRKINDEKIQDKAIRIIGRNSENHDAYMSKLVSDYPDVAERLAEIDVTKQAGEPEVIKPEPALFRIDYKQEGSELVYSAYAKNVVDAVKVAEEKGVTEINSYLVSTEGNGDYYANAFREDNEWIDGNGKPLLNEEQKAEVEQYLQNGNSSYSGKYYDKFEAFEAGQDAYRGGNDEYQVKDLPMALEHPHRHDNIINKEQFMLGFMEQATQEDSFKSIEEAFKTRLPHLDADEYLSIALEKVDRTSSEHDYSELPKLPLRESHRNPEISFELINGDSDKLETFNSASDAMERAIEVNAETIKIREQGQFTIEAGRNEDAEFVMPNGENFSKKYVVNSIQDAAVVEQVIEPVVTESLQHQSTPAVEEATARNHDSVKAADEIPIPPLPDLPDFDIPKPDYSSMPDYGYDDSYDAHRAAQEVQSSKAEPILMQPEPTETPKSQQEPEQPRPEVKPVVPTSATPVPAATEKVDISKPDIKAVVPEQKPEPPKPIPKEVADKYLQVEDKFYFRKNKDVVIFEDKGAKLETKLNSPSVAADLVRIAAERNWTEIKITGTPEFKSEVWMEAESRGIATTGYKPTDIDKAMLKERLAKNQTNAIEEVKVLEKTNEKPSVKQMLDDSVDKKIAEQHLKSHPELKETFEYLESLKKQLEKSGAAETQIKVYMDTTKDGIAQMIKAGKYPEYQKTEHRQDTRQDKQQELQKPQPQAQKENAKLKSKDREMEL